MTLLPFVQDRVDARSMECVPQYIYLSVGIYPGRLTGSGSGLSGRGGGEEAQALTSGTAGSSVAQ